jgi:predicted nucleic acid-binding protein
LIRRVAFWDSSALVPLCVKQSFTAQAATFDLTHATVVWWSTPVEIMSALAQLLRNGQITDPEFDQAKTQANGLSRRWRVIEPSAAIAQRAKTYLEMHPLRAADALQLAAAMEWCEMQPRNAVFLTFDRRLREAARLTGFTLE